MGNTVRKIFTANGTLTVPAGVTMVRIQTNMDVQAVSRPTNMCVAPQTSNEPSANLGGIFMIDNYGNISGTGSNANGCLGIGSITPQSTPVLIPALKNVQQIVEGDNSNKYFALADGKIYAWGNGNLCVGDATARSTPTLVAGGNVYTRLLGGQNGFACYGKDIVGDLWSFAAFGTGSSAASSNSSPVRVLGGLDIRKAITAGRGNAGDGSTCSFFIDANNDLYSAGTQVLGSLGNGTATGANSSPVLVVGGLKWSDVVTVASQGSSALSVCVLGLTTSGAIYGWGAGAKGLLGNGGNLNYSSPVAVAGARTYKALFSTPKNGVSTAWSQVYAITTAGDLYVWGTGYNPIGTGDITLNAISSPTIVAGGITNWKQVVTGQLCAVGLTESGVAYSWGANNVGQLGVGDVTVRSTPTLVSGGLTFEFLFASSWDSSFFGVTTNGRVYAWGGNSNGQLGLGDVVPRSTPTLVVGGVGRLLGKGRLVTVPVTPGTTYAVTLTPNMAKFGTTIVDTGFVDSITVYYDL